MSNELDRMNSRIFESERRVDEETESLLDRIQGLRKRLFFTAEAFHETHARSGSFRACTTHAICSDAREALARDGTWGEKPAVPTPAAMSKMTDIIVDAGKRLKKARNTSDTRSVKP